jgi:hypothetical protein
MNETLPAEAIGATPAWEAEPKHALHQLDRILRGETTRPEMLKKGVLPISMGGLTLVILVLGLIYGACMGCYALFRQEGSSPAQFVATMGKVPLLFGLTFIITFPSLYVFNALVGSRLNLRAVGQLVVTGLAVMLAILASLGPIVAFFSLSTTSYPFMLLLNVVVFSVAGFLGLRFLLVTLHRLTSAQADSRNETRAVRQEPKATITLPTPDGASTEPMAVETVAAEAISVESVTYRDDIGALDRPSGEAWERSVARVFTIWICVFGLVGAQMAWVLRPFLGHPRGEFVLLRLRESNFFEGLLRAITALLGG